MIKSKSELRAKPILDLSGHQGNAFVLLGLAKDYHKELTRHGIELPSLKEIQAEMTSGDYKNLISVFDNYFGNYVDIYR